MRGGEGRGGSGILSASLTPHKREREREREDSQCLSVCCRQQVTSLLSPKFLPKVSGGEPLTVIKCREIE